MLPELGPYVYLQILYNDHKEYATEAKTYSTFNLNQTYDANINNNTKSHQVQPIIDALTQLENIASIQAVKEQQAINSYIQKIQDFLNQDTEETLIPAILKDNLELQLSYIKKMDINSYMNDERNYIQALNITIQNINAYKRRLSELSQLKPNNEIIKQGFEQGAQARVANFLLNRKSRSRTDKNKMRDAQLSKLIKSEIKKLKLPLDFENELYSVFFIDFTAWLANQPNNSISYELLNDTEVTKLFNIYASQNKNSLTETHMYRVFKESQNNQKILNDLLKDMQQTLHSTYLTESEYKKYKQWVEAQQQEIDRAKMEGKKYTPGGLRIHENNYSFKQINDLITTYESSSEQKNKKFRYAFTLETKTSQGNFYERISTIIKNSIDVSGNVAADLILPIATVTFTSKQQEQQKELMALSKDMGNIISSNFQKVQQESINNFNLMVEREKDLYVSLQGRITTSEENIKKISSEGEKFFIAHETTKLYRSAEAIEKNRVVNEFHGRKMKAMTALAKLYASTNLSNNMINSNELITFLINIHQDTLANQANLNPLETYLSIFAGLLMFDDIKEIADADAKEIVQNLNLSTINQVHIYNLGGIYYPLSVILNNLIIQLKKGVNDINNIDYSKTAVTKIYPPASLQYNENKSENTLNNWKTLANTTLHNTEIQIHFLKGFDAYIKDLFKPKI